MQISIYKAQDEPIGKGGMGCVYLASDPKGGKVAIKELRPEFVVDANMRARFHQEIELMDKLDHPSIVKMHASFDWNESLYIVMEYVEGVTLEKYVLSKGRLSEEEAVGILLNILEALGYAHKHGIVHRDIKPSNIMIREGGQKICLLDFGIAKDLNSRGVTVGCLTIGTDGYMSPEQAEGYYVNHLSDIYSMGCLLFYMLTGRSAFPKQANDVATRMAIINDKFPRAKELNPDVSDRIQRILDKATNKNMTLRFQSCNEFAKEIQSNSATVIVESGVNPRISVGRANCDINIYDPERKVSSHHADIEKVCTTGGHTKYVFIDRSTNGTLVNSSKLHNRSMEVWFEPAGGVSSNARPPFPRIYLACLPKYGLDWGKVLEAFRAMDTPEYLPEMTEEEAEVEPQTNPPSKLPERNDSLSTGWMLLALCFPVVGWVMYYQWKGAFPAKATRMAMFAWIGFVAGVILNLIINFS